MKTSTIQYTEDYKLVLTLEHVGIYTQVKFTTHSLDKFNNPVIVPKLELFLTAGELESLKAALDNF